ncbi:hypothetical protein K502DRAFT_87305 [Neoconidiobolus thromboides FSU 785]|nr:hypothetical protein K502DRAFT_87305 [Neoconidiobolus thromboides FSU 785]
MTSYYTPSKPIEIQGRVTLDKKKKNNLKLNPSWKQFSNSIESEKSKWMNLLSPTSLSPKNSFLTTAKKEKYIHSAPSSPKSLASACSPKEMLISEKVLSEQEIDILNSNEFDDVIQFGYRINEHGFTQFTPTIKLSLTPSKLNNNYPRRSLVWPYE